MALIDKASLLMVPSTYEDGTLYNVLPSGNKAPDETGNHNGYDQTRADFTFSRGSNLAATRVNANGLIEKGRENLLTYSNTFSDSDWGKGSSITLTSGQSGYDGTNNAWLLSKGSVQYPSLGQQVSNSGVKTLSVYAKANATSNLCLFVSSSPSNFYQDFDLSNGTLGAGSNGVIATNIDSVGDGWYRCSVVFNGATTSADIFPDTISGANAGSIYIQNAQLENGLVATDYIETGSVSGTAGVLENTPRIDYSSGAGALLLEPQRTNAVTQSEYFGDANWLKTDFGTGSGAPIITANAAISPENLQNAYQIDFPETTGGEQSILQYSYTSVVSTNYTHSIYLKADVASTLILRSAAGPETTINVTTDWKRFDVTAAASSTTSNVKFGLRPTSGSQTAACTIYAWGAQAEAGSYATSYVPTYGSAATRGADSCSVTGVSDVIGQTEGTFFFEIGEKTTESIGIFEAGQGSSQYRFFVYTDTSKKLKVLVVDNYAVQVSYTSSVNVESNAKIAVAYKANDYAIYLNGSQLSTDTSASVPPMNQLAVGSDRGGVATATNNTKQAVLFNERLSNAELAALTA